MHYYLEFDAFDNPMQLSKVGNWVITFLSLADQPVVELAITYVLPRQLSQQLQPRRVLIQQTEHPNRWLIQAIECFDSSTQAEISLDAEHETSQQAVSLILEEFKKYDVNVELVKP